MTASARPKTIEELFRDHLREMRSYATDRLQPVFGPDNPIVKRILGCATSNEWALDRIVEINSKKAQPTCCPCHQAGADTWPNC
jgi:hypothetical protein